MAKKIIKELPSNETFDKIASQRKYFQISVIGHILSFNKNNSKTHTQT